MKQPKYTAMIFMVIFAVLPGTAPGQPKEQGRLIFEEGFESGQPPYRASGNSPEVIKVSDARAGDYVMKSELNSSSEDPERTEAVVFIDEERLMFEIGQEYWVGISIKLDENFRDSTEFKDQGMLLQWHYQDKNHPEVRDAQPLLLRFKNDEVRVHNEVLEEYMARTSPEYGKWIDWVFHVRFSDTDGIIEVWRQGTKIVDFRGDNHQVEKHEGAYLKFGLYSSQYEKAPLKGSINRTVYHDELRIAGSDGSYDLVVPRDSKRSEDHESEQASGQERPAR
ncbi:MAG: heparin lyase I family protein [Verrucomicrobiota bacterium]